MARQGLSKEKQSEKKCCNCTAFPYEDASTIEIDTVNLPAKMLNLLAAVKHLQVLGNINIKILRCPSFQNSQSEHEYDKGPLSCEATHSNQWRSDLEFIKSLGSCDSFLLADGWSMFIGSSPNSIKEQAA